MNVPTSVLVALRLLDVRGAKMAGNRVEWVCDDGRNEYRVVRRDRSEPDGYERTEVYELLLAVRACERVQKWKCPEPTEGEIQGAARRMLPPRMP